MLAGGCQLLFAPASLPTNARQLGPGVRVVQAFLPVLFFASMSFVRSALVLETPRKLQHRQGCLCYTERTVWTSVQMTLSVVSQDVRF